MKIYSNINIYFGVWLISLFLIFSFGFFYFPRAEKSADSFWGSLSHWDGAHFITIAQHGYINNSEYAFFPLYPLLIKVGTYITNNYQFSAVALSTIFTLLALNLFYRLLVLEFDKKIAEKGVLNLLIFPTSFYLVTAYSESLFLFLAILTFYYLKKNNLMAATITTILATATRITGIALVLALILHIVSTGGLNRRNWFVWLSPMGLIIYGWYLYLNTQDPLYFITAEKYWFRFINFPWVSFWDTIHSLSTVGFIKTNFNILLDFIFAIFGVGLILRSFRFLHPSLAFYGLISIIIPIVTSTLMSFPRFLLPIFPIFMVLALVKNKYFNFAYQIISVMLLAAFSILFINGYWVS